VAIIPKVEKEALVQREGGPLVETYAFLFICCDDAVWHDAGYGGIVSYE